MAEAASGNSVTGIAPLQIPLAQDHAPAISSPLNPEPKAKAAKPPPREREQREKKDSLKKRESAAQGKDTTSAIPAKRKASVAAPSAPSPLRFAINPPRPSDYDPPREATFASHEPLPIVTPDGQVELKKCVDSAENKKGYRYNHCIADPLFKHKQHYRQTDILPFGARMSFEDADKWIHFDDSGKFLTNERGWRMARANVCAREGSLYYEVRIVKGVPAVGSPLDEVAAGPQPHVRVGWARREAPLDTPVGFDGYSYGITDARFEPMHRSRSSKYFTVKDKKANGAKKAAAAGAAGKGEREALEIVDNIREGDVLGLEIILPSLSLQRKVVSGVYNPAVDIGDGFEDTPAGKPESDADTYDVIRDRIAVPYKSKLFFETMDYVSTKSMELYTDRTLSLSNLSASGGGGSGKEGIKVAPNPNHVDAPLRTLPGSSIRVYKNGSLVGTAFENLLSFLPPSSAPSKLAGAREGFDDGMLGYFPAVSCFSGGIAEVNLGEGGEGFWFPPPHLRRPPPTAAQGQQAGRELRPIGERFREQVAEDIVWDVIDEVDFFMQDGGFEGKVGAGAGDAKRGVASLKEEID